MNNILELSVFFALGTVAAVPRASMGADPVQWVWASGNRSGASFAEFKEIFSIDAMPSGKAELRVVGDFCALEVFVNGSLAAATEPYDPPLAADVKPLLRLGTNRISIAARGVEGPSAVALELAFFDGDSETPNVIMVSNGHWEGAEGIAPLASIRLGGSPLKEIGALDEYNQWMEARGKENMVTSPSQFSPLPDGFELEQLRVAGTDEGSWVSMAFDSRGRLVIAKEQRGLLRMAFEDARVSSVETIDDSLLECRGLLFAHDALYANANNSKALYRLRDTDDDDRFDEIAVLMETGGGVGHGRNDLALAPSGMIYSIHGDSVKLPDGIRRLTPPAAAGKQEKGYLVRFDKDGNERELLAIGLRNPYGIAFNRDGEPFTFDADNEGDIGLPLYRPTRVNHLVSGANYGWLQADGESWQVYFPDSLPSTLDIGRGSPTAVEFGYKSNFPARYRDALFILDWAYGRIIAVDVIGRGASYLCQAEMFLRGRPLNVTDLAFGPDRALYFITGGRGTQSALFRIGFKGEAIADRNLTAQELARRTYSEAARETRRQLEGFHRPVGADAVAEIWPFLEDGDLWIRHAARVALEHQPFDTWRDRALNSPSLTALLAFARVASISEFAEPGFLEIVRKRGFPGLSRTEKLTVLRIHEIALRARIGHPEVAANCRAFFSPSFPDRDASINRELSTILIELGDESAVPKALALLAAADSQSEQLHYLEILSRAGNGWTIEGRRAFFGNLRHKDYFRGDSNMPGYLQRIRDRAIASLGEDERKVLNSIIEVPETGQEAPLQALQELRPLVQHWKTDDIVASPEKEFETDLSLGRKIFEDALCSRCHQLGSIGSAVGPNLTAVAQRFSRRDLVEAILDPSRAVAEIFRPLVIELKDGTTVAGRVVRDDIRNSTLSIATNPFAPENLTLVPKRDIRTHETAPLSPMPPGLLDTFTAREILQLLAFLESGGAG